MSDKKEINRHDELQTDVLASGNVSRETKAEKKNVKRVQKEQKKKAQLDVVRQKGGITDDDPYDFDNPTLRELYRDFRSNKLTPVESGFNALYLWCYDNYYSSGVPVKNKYKNIYAHPSAWFKNAHHMWRHNKWSVIVRLLDIIPAVSKWLHSANDKRQQAGDRLLNTMEHSHKSAKQSAKMLCIIASICGIVLMTALFGDAVQSKIFGSSPALMMFVNGEYVTNILSISDVEKAKKNIESTMSSKLGTAYKLDYEISYKATTISDGSHSNVAGIEREFNEIIHRDMKSGYGLYAYNTLIAVAENQAWLEDSKNESLAQRLHERQKQDSSIESLHYNGFTIRQNSYPEDYFSTLNEIRAMFSLPELESDEAQQQVANDQKSDYLSISGGAPVLANESRQDSSDGSDSPQLIIPIVETKTVTEIVPIPYSTTITYDSDMPENKREIVQKGKDGSKSVVFLVEYVGNDLISKKAFEDGAVIRYEPQNEIVVQGTRPLTEEEKRTASTGTYIYPSSGPLSSGYSWRSWGKYNEFHKGIDLRYQNKGDDIIIASDGGTIIQAKNKGDGYGICILIQHDDGTITRYAHLSKLAKNYAEGTDRVAQGETIGTMGSTGNSTGVHLHFEIIKDGSVQNPMIYLPERD